MEKLSENAKALKFLVFIRHQQPTTGLLKLYTERSDRMAINNTLKDIRTERNLIQEDLAEATGSCSRTIGRIERGERNPSLEMAIRLAHYLNMSVEEIFTLDDNNSSYQKAEE